MRALIQRTSGATVTVDDEVVGDIGPGLVIFVCAGGRLYEHFKAQVREHGVAVSSGRFGAEMGVFLVNDGPVTIWLDTAQR